MENFEMDVIVKVKSFDDSRWGGILDDFVDELKKQVDFEDGTLFLFDKETETLEEVIKVGNGIDFISSVNFPMGAGLSAWVAQKGKIICLSDIHRGSRHGLNPIRAYLSIPLEINNRNIGVLNLGHTTPNAFDGEKLERIESFCKEITRKIYNLSYLNFVEHEEDNYIS